ncbi:MAG: hypothetical protein AAF845_13570 [Bacteroidota bacterium]
MSQPHPPITPSPWPVPPTPTFAGWTPPAPKGTTTAASATPKKAPQRPTAQS